MAQHRIIAALATATALTLTGCNVASPYPIATTPHEDQAWDIWEATLAAGRTTCLIERDGVEMRYAITDCAIARYYDATGATQSPATE